jgi:hypothetical protein
MALGRGPTILPIVSSERASRGATQFRPRPRRRIGDIGAGIGVRIGLRRHGLIGRGPRIGAVVQCAVFGAQPAHPVRRELTHGLIAAKLTAVRAGRIRRLIVSLPPRHLKSHLASVAFPAWCLGLEPSSQILCVSYAQDLADKLSRDCRRILASEWYQRLFPTRLAPRHQAVPEFETTAQGSRVATSVGGVLTGRGADLIVIDDPLKPEEALSQTQRQAANEWYDHTLYSRLNDKLTGAIVLIMHRLHESLPRA